MGIDVVDLLSSLRHELSSKKSKPIQIHYFSWQISLALSAIRITSCKSAKDRTGMSITLEQARWLQECEGMKASSFNVALKKLRSQGLRIQNLRKNVGSTKYAFNQIALMSFPRLYRPPDGTYSSNILT